MRQVWVIAQNTLKALIRKKDFYVFFIMLLLLFVFLISEDFFGIKDISRHAKDIGFFCLWLFSLIIAITFSAKQMPEEINSKTVFPLLAKPVSRFHFLLGRFLGSVLAATSAYTLFYLLYVAVISLRGEGIAIPLLLEGYVFGICLLSMICAISIFLSLYFTLSAAIMLSFIVYFAIMWFADGLRAIVLSNRGFNTVLLTIVYYLIPHYEFYDLRIRLVHSWEALPLWVVFATVAYTLFYTSGVLYLSHLRLRNKVL